MADFLLKKGYEIHDIKKRASSFTLWRFNI